MVFKKEDNTTLDLKVALRRLMLERMESAPVVCETHGGLGAVWTQVYPSIVHGIVFEKDEQKAAVLAMQRPTWAVYEGDCEKALAAGAGDHLLVNVLDVDPYGAPWDAIEGFFSSDRPRAPRLWVVVNDGLRGAIQFGTAWHVASLETMIHKYGNELHARYIDVCEDLLQEKAAQAGYGLRRFAGYHCGTYQRMTHYLAEFTLSETGGDHA